MLRIRDVYPRSEFFHPGSRVKKIPDHGSGSKNWNIFNPKIVSKLSEICSGMFIPDLDFTHPGSRGQKGTSPESWSATLYQIMDCLKQEVAKKWRKIKLFHANCFGVYIYLLSSGSHLYRTVPTSLSLTIRTNNKDGTEPIRASVAWYNLTLMGLM